MNLFNSQTDARRAQNAEINRIIMFETYSYGHIIHTIFGHTFKMTYQVIICAMNRDQLS